MIGTSAPAKSVPSTPSLRCLPLLRPQKQWFAHQASGSTTGSSSNHQGINKWRIQNFSAQAIGRKNDSELATSDVIGYSVGNGLELRLMRGVARKRFNLQAAFLAKSHPELRLIKRQLSNGKPSYAIGLIQTYPTNQTCFVEGARSKDAFAVTRNDLSLIIDQQSSRTKWSTLKSIIGLQPNRDYQCILVQAQSTDKTATAIDQHTRLRMLHHSSSPTIKIKPDLNILSNLRLKPKLT